MFWSSRLKDFLITLSVNWENGGFLGRVVTIHSISPQGWFHGHGAFYTIDKMRFEGEFRGGRIWGNGLITYPDETPGIEGYFQDARWDRFGVSRVSQSWIKLIMESHSLNLVCSSKICRRGGHTILRKKIYFLFAPIRKAPEYVSNLWRQLCSLILSVAAHTLKFGLL